MEKNKNAIISLAFNYSAEKLRPFINSLDATGFSGDLILLINKQSEVPSDRKYNFSILPVNVEESSPSLMYIHRYIGKVMHLVGLHQFWIQIHRHSILKCLKQNVTFSKWILSFLYGNFYMATARFPFYYNILIKKRYSAIFFTDIADVVFQKDLFAGFEKEKVLAFEENAFVKLGDEPHNRAWIEKGYGNEILAAIADVPIHCSGTILCKYNACIEFLKDFITHIVSEKIPTYMIGFDQGIFNYMVSFKKKDYFESIPNGDIVYTMGTLKASDFVIQGQTVQTASNATPAVLHQYNRHALLNQAILEKYVKEFQ